MGVDLVGVDLVGGHPTHSFATNFPTLYGSMGKLVGLCITILVLLLLGVSSEKKHITAVLIYTTIVLWEDWQVSDYGLAMNT